jgi:hypothetical protein
VLATQAEGFLADALDRHAVRKNSDALQRDALLGTQ